MKKRVIFTHFTTKIICTYLYTTCNKKILFVKNLLAYCGYSPTSPFFLLLRWSLMMMMMTMMTVIWWQHNAYDEEMNWGDGVFIVTLYWAINLLTKREKGHQDHLFSEGGEGW